MEKPLSFHCCCNSHKLAGFRPTQVFRELKSPKRVSSGYNKARGRVEVEWAVIPLEALRSICFLFFGSFQ